MTFMYHGTYYYKILQAIRQVHQTHVVRSIQMNSDGDYLLQNHILSMNLKRLACLGTAYDMLLYA